MAACSFKFSLLVVIVGIEVAAFPSFQSKLPNGASVQRNGLPHPGVGHVSSNGGGALNPFGVDFQGAGRSWTTALCQKDSDGDGQTNGFELGDPDCVWEEGQTPQRTTSISHPGFADSLSSASSASIPAAPVPTRVPTPPPTDATVVVNTPVPTFVVAPSHCDSLVAELYRRQSVEFPSSSGEAFEGNVSLKHKPFLQIWNKTATITVSPRSLTGDISDPLHPMTDSSDTDAIHYIDTLFAIDQNGDVASLRRLSPTEEAPASFSFVIPEGVTALTPYEHCNKHGLFKGDTVAVLPDQAAAGSVSGCSLAVCEDVSHQDCASTGVELLRQHKVAFNVLAPFIGNTSLKHKPYLTILGTKATVVVGLGALQGQEGQPIHPMVPSANPAKVHWVDHIYVKNQDDVVVAMRDLDATEESPATLTFEVPEGTIQLVAYEHCNLHGLFRGDVIPVISNQTASGQNASCQARFCNGQVLIPTLPSSTTTAVWSEGVYESETASNAMQQSSGAVIVIVLGLLAGSVAL